jgi:hypothetical protein
MRCETGAKKQEPRIKRQEPRIKNQEPRAKNQETRAKNQEKRWRVIARSTRFTVILRIILLATWQSLDAVTLKLENLERRAKNQQPRK